MKGGNTYNASIDPVIMSAVVEYVQTHNVNGRELVMEVPKIVLPEVPLHIKRNAICQMRLQGVIKFNGFRCKVTE